MALLNIFDIAGSALAAQSKRLNVAASNLANADSVTGPDGQPYRAKQVVFQVDAAPGQATGGVKVASVIESRSRKSWFMSQAIRWRTLMVTSKCPTSMWSAKWSTRCQPRAAIRQISKS